MNEGASNRFTASIKYTQLSVVGNTSIFPNNIFDSVSFCPTSYRSASVNATPVIGSEAKITDALAGAFSRPTAFAHPIITAGTSTHFTIMYAIERYIPIENGLLPDKNTPVVNRATGSVQLANADRKRKIKPEPGAYVQLGCTGGVPALIQHHL